MTPIDNISTILFCNSEAGASALSKKHSRTYVS